MKLGAKTHHKCVSRGGGYFCLFRGLSMFRDDASESSDDFDALRSGLPQCETLVVNDRVWMFRDDSSSDKFSRWQMARFNRSGTFDIYCLLCLSVSVSLKHVIPLILLYISYLSVCVLSFHFCLPWVFVLVDALASLCATSISFSFVTSESLGSRVARLVSLQGLGLLTVQMVRSIVLYYIVTGFLARDSSVTFRLLLLLLINYFTYFHACFVCEGLNLSFLEKWSFSLNLMCSEIPFMKSVSVFFLGMFLQSVAPLTLGFTGWVGYMIRVFVFIAVCGSGSNLANGETLFD